MTRITNNFIQPLGLPGGPVIAPGATEKVRDWETMHAASRIVQRWVKAGILTVVPKGEKAPAAPAASNAGDSGESQGQSDAGGENGGTESAQGQQTMDAKDKLIAELNSFGVTANRRMSEKTLSEKLAEAKAAAESAGAE